MRHDARRHLFIGWQRRMRLGMPPWSFVMRSVTEWIGKTDDSKPPQSCKLRILDRQDNKCALTDHVFVAGDDIEFDHKIAIWLGGENRETNLQAVIRSAHKRKTKAEASVRSKINNQKAKHLLGRKTKARPFPGSKADKWKKRIDGTVVAR